MAKKDKGFIATRRVPKADAEKLIGFFQSFGDELPSVKDLQTKIEKETITVREAILLAFYNKGISADSVDDILITNYGRVKDGNKFRSRTDAEKKLIENSLKKNLEKYINISNSDKSKTISSWMKGIINLETYYDKTSQSLDSPLKTAFNTNFMVNDLFQGVTSRPAAASIIGDVVDAVSSNVVGWQSEPLVGNRKLPSWLPEFKTLKVDLLTKGITAQKRDLIGAEGAAPSIAKSVSPSKHFETLITSLQTIPDQDIRNFMYMSHFIPTRLEKLFNLTYGAGKSIPYYDPERQMIVFQPDFSKSGTLEESGMKKYHNFQISDAMAAFIENIKNSKGLQNGQRLFPDDDEGSFSNKISSQLASQGDEGFTKRTQSRDYDSWGRRAIKYAKDMRAVTSTFYLDTFPDMSNALKQLMGHVLNPQKTSEGRTNIQSAYGGVIGDPNYMDDAARMMEKQEELFIEQWREMYRDEIFEYEKTTGRKLDLRTGHLPFLVNVDFSSDGIYNKDFSLDLSRLPTNVEGSMAGLDVLKTNLKDNRFIQRLQKELEISFEDAKSTKQNLERISPHRGGISPEIIYDEIFSMNPVDEFDSATDARKFYLTAFNMLEDDIKEENKAKQQKAQKLQPTPEVKETKVETQPTDELVEEPKSKTSEWKNPADVLDTSENPDYKPDQGMPDRISDWLYSRLRDGNKLKNVIGPIIAGTAAGLASFHPVTRPLAGPLLKEAGLETGLQTFDPTTIGERPEGGFAPDFGLQLPQSLDMNEMENYLRAAQRFEVSGDPNLETAADRMYDQYAQNFRDQASIEARNDLATHKYTEEDFTTSALDRYNYAQSLPKPSEMPEVNRQNLQKDFGRELFQKDTKGETPLGTLEQYEEEMRQLFDLPT
tara:strand:- start:11733 stop:14381 length:2649 start_codon:yes stop_codon:yes gene_type:complete